MNDTLKVAGRIGAELGAAKAENEKLRGLLREVRVLLANNSYKISGTAAFLSSIDAALSQQAEPVEFEWPKLDKPAQVGAGTFCVGVSAKQVVEAAKRLYQYEQDPPFRQDQIAALRSSLGTEPAPAQDERAISEREAFDKWFRRTQLISDRVDTTWITAAFLPYKAWMARAALARPAQTEQQPIRLPERKPDFPSSDATGEDWENSGWNAALDEVARLNAAPIAQTAPQGKFRMGDLVKKSTGSEWEGRVVGWYSTEQTKEGYAVESSAHRNSVQIYPVTALEAVE